MTFHLKIVRCVDPHCPCNHVKWNTVRLPDPTAKACATYRILPTGSIECLRCGTVSDHPEDVKRKYCGNCREVHKPAADPGFDPIAALAQVERWVEDNKPGAPLRQQILDRLIKMGKLIYILALKIDMEITATLSASYC
jgi:hypothetical protein